MHQAPRKTDPRRRRALGQGGFTLVELVVVLFVIGVLASIAVIVYFKFIFKTRETVALTYIHRVIKAEELYFMDNETYTDNFNHLGLPGTTPSGGGNNVRLYEGYRYILSVGTSGEPTWTLRAEPEDRNDKMKWYYADHTGTIRYEVGREAGPTSPVI